MALQTIGDLFISLFATYQGFLYLQRFYILTTHELAQQFLLIFPTYMYFRELRIWHGMLRFHAALELWDHPSLGVVAFTWTSHSS